MNASRTRRVQLALAADLPLDEAIRLYREVSPWFSVVKVGMSLFVEHGPRAVRAFAQQGAKVFLDLKLHDIPNTVELAAAQAAKLQVAFLTVHGAGGQGMLRAAVRGARRGARARGVKPPTLLAVTALTSLSAKDLMAMGCRAGVERFALQLAAAALEEDVRGLVCSPLEVKALRGKFGRAPFICTPGVRPGGAGPSDQRRTGTAARAVEEGADLLVVGRPIYEAKDPSRAAEGLAQEVAGAFFRR